MTDIPREFVFARYPARQGIVWLAAGYAMFKAQRLAWIIVVAAFAAGLFLLEQVPFLGPFVALVMLPVFTVGLLAAAWTQERGGKPELRHLLQGFRANIYALLAIGVFYVGGLSLAMLTSWLVDGGTLLELLTSGKMMTPEQAAAQNGDPRLLLSMLVVMVLMVCVLVAAFWAPAIIVFQDARSVAALRASFRAALANWRPLTIYALAVFFYIGILPAMIGAVLNTLIPAPLGASIAVWFMTLYTLVFAATLHASHYVSYRDVFHSGETLAPLARTP